ncbi:hypothetical protein Mag101_03335 [Microbulbifer agarilyticus]|uniref:Cytochrome c-552/DMSO reductase-like haem-binding domain-containing protein n=1 Tax=Microbulbifer agarilyticus TaxID=260552 RepID=A0A1Q2M2B8_9GAMM|nr:hypothetical protein Mag101_03335 [Microbulbifer agarilyticus]
MATRKGLSWIWLHSAVAVAVLCSLLTGLRIASLSYPQLIQFEELLPQGNVIQWHFFSAVMITLIGGIYLAHRLNNSDCRKWPTASYWVNKCRWPGWHRVIIRAGYPLLVLSLVSGWMLFWGISTGTLIRAAHLGGAIAIALYLVAHAGLYLVRWGRQSIWLIVVPHRDRRKLRSLVLSGALVLTTSLSLALGWYLLGTKSHYQLHVNRMLLLDDRLPPIEIDGVADEIQWRKATAIRVHTDGGANFDNGETEVTLRALSNGEEFYLFARWRDATKSLLHLPLVKTGQGWEVQQKGFHNFDETRYYEDKFAVLLSSSCTFSAAGTAHLGRNPLPNHPPNWHGKGYHYSSDNQLHDLWHWKAVRTNDMYLADDNFIGPPDKVRAGERRYTAGYQQDGKESGAYVMNWQWYNPNTITPKRLPSAPAQLAALQQVDLAQVQSAENQDEEEWVIPWFDFEPYSSEQDASYPIGTVMPSVMYNSNRFEGDRADVRARGRWHEGYWHLELVRKLVTGSALDVPITDGTCLWVSAFDRAQVAHTRHTRAIRLTFSPAYTVEASQ